MKFVMAESGVGWTPYILNRMYEEYEDRFSDINLSMKPSEYCRPQVKVVAMAGDGIIDMGQGRGWPHEEPQYENRPEGKEGTC